MAQQAGEGLGRPVADESIRGGEAPRDRRRRELHDVIVDSRYKVAIPRVAGPRPVEESPDHALGLGPGTGPGAVKIGRPEVVTLRHGDREEPCVETAGV